MDQIEELLTRGVDKIYPSKEELEKVLRSGKKLRLYQGFDPTGKQLHIGHMVGFRKLRQWQDLGHEVIFLVGDGTGQAGDPSGKKSAREKFFTNEELRENARDYLLQASKIVRFDGPNPVKIMYNGDWLNKLNLAEILSIAQNFSVQQLIERDMYQERIKRGESINLREFLYPLLQGYDSVAMQVDLELGGSDQTFNMLTGRTLVKAMLGKEKFVMTTPLLSDANGNKIGKSEGNVIGVTDSPAELFGKVMTLPDSTIINALIYLTNLSMAEIDQIRLELDQGKNPMIAKKTLAHLIVSQLNNEEAAEAAQEQFEMTFQKGDASNADLPTMQLSELGALSDPIELLTITATATSKAEAKRLLEQNAVELNGQTIAKESEISLKSGDILKVGKRQFIKFV